MALKQKSLFLYGFTVTPNNQFIEFASVNTQTPSTAFVATLTLGYYSLTGLLAEITRAMNAADPLRTFTVTANRTVAGGLENRVTISTNGSYLKLFFQTGVRAAASARTLIGFQALDYTGVTSTGNSSAGTALVPTLVGYNYLDPNNLRTIFGSVNVSATGEKEAVVYNTQLFWEVNFKYEPRVKIDNEWTPFLTWAIKQRLFEFTPEITSPTVFFEGTLERTVGDGKGLGYSLKEMLPSFPDFYETGVMRFRQRSVFASLI